MLIDYCEANLADPTLWKTPAGYPDSLAMCIIDAVYSPGSQYKSVVGVVLRYRARHPYGGEHGTEDLHQSITAANGPRRWAESAMRSVRPDETKSGVALKVKIIQQAIRLMVDLGIGTVEDLRQMVQEDPRDNPVRSGWLALMSGCSEETYDYLLMLAGLPFVPPDKMVLSFLAGALGEGTVTSSKEADALLTGTARHLGVERGVLHHIIWRAACGRELSDLSADLPTAAGE